MSFNPDKLTFKTDDITGEIIQPRIFLCDRQLNKIGEIFPVHDLRIKSVLNGADEISFRTHKQIKNYNDRDLAYLNKRAAVAVSNGENILYDRITDYSVVFAEGFGYFEVSPTINDTYTSVKNLHGSSLGESELSQLFCTLECNTDEDITNFLKLHTSEKYISTVLYSDEDKDHSLIHRILSYAPGYTVGRVDNTVKNIQRTFSFSNKDIISCFSEIAEEVGCIFDVVVRRDEDGAIGRTVNIYDAQYCGNCQSRHIINGVCQDCGSKEIDGVGEDTTIMVSTDNLSDEITLTPDGSMKNCFIIKGGDDMITSTVEGVLPSGTNKLYMFSPDTIQHFSSGLKSKYDEYINQFNNSREPYADLLELEYNIFDLILYLQSGRMPAAETSGRSLHEEADHIISKYNSLFPNGLGLTDTSDTTSRNGMIRQVFSLFVDSGYAVKQEDGNYDAQKLRWTGDIIVYEIGNNSSQAVITVSDNSSTIRYSDGTTTKTIPFCVKFSEDYETYLKQMVAITTKNYELIEDQGLNNPKDWQKYSLNQLYSYKSGYELCIETLNELERKSGLSDVETVNGIRDKYLERIDEISNYMERLEDIIYHLYSYFGSFNSCSSATSASKINYSEYTPKIFPETADAFQNMVHYIKYGTWYGGRETSSTDHPIYCKTCGSSNVTMTGCNRCKSSDVCTYGSLAGMVYDSYMSNPASLETQRADIQAHGRLRDFLDGELYRELCSFIREDVYDNGNFVSDGLSNSEIIQKSKELIQRAEQELAKACISQHTLSGNIYAFAAYSRLSGEDFPIDDVYGTFKLGNFMWYFADDGKKYKLRLSSEEFLWSESGAELNVEFTDVIQYLGGGISDLASLMQTVGSLSTSFDSVKKQAGQGAEANLTFQRIKNEGLQSALSNVLNARDIDVQIDEHGITLRKYDYELDGYSPYQMKLINRNIVMTDDSWKTARMAIGLGRYGEGSDAKLVYGVWADLLVGNMLVGENLLIQNKDCTVEINGSGIVIKNGFITWDKVNPPEISNINGLANRLNDIDTDINEAEDNAKGYTDGVREDLNTSLTNAYKVYADSEVAKLDTAVAGYLIPGSTTLVGESVVISPYIGGGYLNITGEPGNAQNQVIVDPKNLTGTGYIFAVKHGDDFTVGVKPDGTASFKGSITATSLTLEGCEIPYGKISGTPEIPSDIKDLTDTNETLKNIMYKGDITSVTKTDSYGNTYTEHTVPGKTGNITYKTYDTDSYMLFGKPAGNGQLGGDGSYVCISKNGLLEANNAVIYGTVYATDGEFSGSIYSKSGTIGGWNIEENTISSFKNDNEGLYLDGDEHRIVAYNIHKFGYGGTDNMKQRDRTVIEQGKIVCMSNTFIGNPNNTGDNFKQSSLTLNGDGILFESGLQELDEVFNIGHDEIIANKPVSVNDTLSVNGTIEQNNKPLGDLYCVVKTGEQQCNGTGTWTNFTVNFGVTYKSEPFINIMPTSLFDDGNIAFVGFGDNDNDTNGYTQLKYAVYGKTAGKEYNTRWFAVGNIKQ